MAGIGLGINDLIKRTMRRFQGGHSAKAEVREVSFNYHSAYLDRIVPLTIFLPEDYTPEKESCRLLLFNDGQDMPALKMRETLQNLFDTRKIRPTIVVGIHANQNRIREYGTASQADYKGRGDLAQAHTDFVTEELLPYLRSQYPLSEMPLHTAYAGCSLGGLSALDMVWARPDIFGLAGTFSGALWWRSVPVSDDDPDGSRIIHDIIGRSAPRFGMRFWFECGTLDEEEDRNNNGIIDSIDDTVDLINVLKNHGYRNNGNEIRYVEVPGGEHNQATWAMVLPDFLCWAFGGENFEFRES